MVLLHGTLDVTVHEARHLPASAATQAFGAMKRVVCCGFGPDLLGSCDPYVCLDVGGTRRLRSSFVQSTHNPVWDERAEVLVADEADEMKVQVKDADIVGAEFLGEANIPISSILDGRVFQDWLLLCDTTGQPVGRKDKLRGVFEQAAVRLTIKYTPVGDEDGPLGEVPRVYFPMRRGNRITLYHDAVATPGPVEGIQLAGGKAYHESSCWDDMYEAILQAKRFIWIAGWSVWDKTRLRRIPDREDDSPTLGELLITKANQGVNVLLLVWDDRSNNLGLHPGLMATHDQTTYSYFKHTGVTCVLCPRQGGIEETFLQNMTTGNLFTHHQKTVVLDAPIPGTDQHPSLPNSPRHRINKGRQRRNMVHEPRRRVIAFVGGLDLTDGRYDRHDHPMFETCGPGGPHCEDFHQACVDGFDAGRSCLREPWHDIHARVEGQVAIDICLNFMERWVKQAGKRHRPKMRHLDDHHDLQLPRGFEAFTSKAGLLKYAVSPEFMDEKVQMIKRSDSALAIRDLPAPESWAVQLFRSIDSDSASGFPDMSQGGFEAGLSVGKGKVIDTSIHDAYVHLIRRAKRYLYLENQYFLGGAHLWDSNKDTPCFNLVPVEIALKIVSKIKAGQQFRAYIVMPMYPEGVPTTGSVQAILHHQTQTRQMMYKLVTAAIREAGLQDHPTDYLQFFCLGKREPHDTHPGGSGAADGAPAPGSNGDAAVLPAQSPAPNAGLEQPQAAATLDQSPQQTPADNAGWDKPPPGGAPNPLEAKGQGRLHATKDEHGAMPYGDETPAQSGGGGGQSQKEKGPADLPAADPNTAQFKCTAARRFMIYVHSKLMIVDDEYALLGSANINQRSLDGTRDSEICVGSFQEGYTMRNHRDQLPQGQVAGFRKALWMEHIKHLGREHDDPSSIDCMRSLQQTAQDNWLAYNSPDIQPLPRGHLMIYPTEVDEAGNVIALSDCEEIPDLGGKILGVRSNVLPGVLTT